mmetsp:Transcript_10304/g.32651  ORF Transcript_10304/g.32651 Transcript_10304/m.32651 type:complete len:308 (-) Transcript_10304:8000-8923(-)
MTSAPPVAARFPLARTVCTVPEIPSSSKAPATPDVRPAVLLCASSSATVASTDDSLAAPADDAVQLSIRTCCSTTNDWSFSTRPPPSPPARFDSSWLRNSVTLERPADRPPASMAAVFSLSRQSVNDTSDSTPTSTAPPLLTSAALPDRVHCVAVARLEETDHAPPLNARLLANELDSQVSEQAEVMATAPPAPVAVLPQAVTRTMASLPPSARSPPPMDTCAVLLDTTTSVSHTLLASTALTAPPATASFDSKREPSMWRVEAPATATPPPKPLVAPRTTTLLMVAPAAFEAIAMSLISKDDASAP